MTAAVGLLLALACTAAGVAWLRAAWARRGGGRRLAAGWGALALSLAGWRLTGAAWDKAAGLAVLACGLAALATVAAGADLSRRGARRREPREVEPPPGGGPAWRGWVRALCAGPLGLVAALGCSAWATLHGPGDGADRLVAAGFVLPAVWAAAGVWATTDERLGRVALALTATAGLGFALARA